MAAGIFFRDVLRMPLRLVFTSASQRHHTWTSRALIARMDSVISTSARTAAYLNRPSTVIPHGIDAHAFRPAADRMRVRAELGLREGLLVGCIGRIRRQKGTDVFVDAMIRLLADFPDAAAFVLGRATPEHAVYLAGLKERARAAGLGDRITFHDEVPPDATSSWYQALDVLVAPQLWEGFGVTPLEAAACGVPVVATTVGAFPDLVVDGETGWLVPPNDAAAIAQATRRLLADGEMRSKFGTAARRRAMEMFTLIREAEAINAVYRDLWNGSQNRLMLIGS